MSEWQTVSGGGGTFVKFAQDGQIVEGVLTAKRAGSFGSLYDVRQKDGSILTFGGSYVLDEQLPALVGKVIRVTRLGMKDTKKGGTVKTFKIEVSPDEAEDYLHPAKAADDDDSLPFNEER